MTARAQDLSATGEELPVPPAVPSFQSVYDEHFDFVWRSLRALGVPESSIDDAVQDLFVVVHRRLSEFEGRSSVRSWLFGIARKIALRALRAKQRDVKDFELEASRIESQEPSPRDIAERAESTRILLRLLDSLDEEKRAVFFLVEVEQMRVPDAAAILGWNVNTTYSRLRLARERLRRAAAHLRRASEVTDV